MANPASPKNLDFWGKKFFNFFGEKADDAHKYFLLWDLAS